MARVSAAERAATRARLLDAGKAEFAVRGLAGARFDEISLSAGHAKGTIYNYFASKEALFLAIVEEWCQLLVDAASSIPEGSVHDRLVELARLDTEVARKDPELALVVVQQLPALVGADRDAAETALRGGLDLLEHEFDTGLASGELRSALPGRALGRLFLATLSAFEVEALQLGAVISLDDISELMSTHFLHGLRP